MVVSTSVTRCDVMSRVTLPQPSQGLFNPTYYGKSHGHVTGTTHKYSCIVSGDGLLAPGDS
jgi:hypothetical protein